MRLRERGAQDLLGINHCAKHHAKFFPDIISLNFPSNPIIPGSIIIPGAVIPKLQVRNKG